MNQCCYLVSILLKLVVQCKSACYAAMPDKTSGMALVTSPCIKPVHLYGHCLCICQRINVNYGELGT